MKLNNVTVEDKIEYLKEHASIDDVVILLEGSKLNNLCDLFIDGDKSHFIEWMEEEKYLLVKDPGEKYIYIIEDESIGVEEKTQLSEESFYESLNYNIEVAIEYEDVVDEGLVKKFKNNDEYFESVNGFCYIKKRNNQYVMKVRKPKKSITIRGIIDRISKEHAFYTIDYKRVDHFTSEIYCHNGLKKPEAYEVTFTIKKGRIVPNESLIKHVQLYEAKWLMKLWLDDVKIKNDIKGWQKKCIKNY